MRILHTADWHVGKKLGRIDRSSETEAVLDELVAIVRDSDIDLVVVAGDLFDRALPPFMSLRLVLDTLVRLADAGARVAAIPGNHDSQDLFEVLAPHLAHSGVTLVHKALPPDRGGVVRIPARAGDEGARVAFFPFLHEAHVVDFMESHDRAHTSYADRVREICKRYALAMGETSDATTVDVLVGHFMIHGAVPSGSERELHIGEAYMARPESVPAAVHYAALGHIHRAQPAPGSEDRARYSGSLMQLDFGEAGHDKSVAIVDVTPHGRRRIEEVPITAGRTLARVEGTLEELRARAGDLRDAILDVSIRTDGPAPGLADDVRAFLPDALYVRALYERDDGTRERSADIALTDLYDAYRTERYGAPPSAELADAFRDLCDEVGVSL